MMELAVNALCPPSCTCVVVQEGEVVYKAAGLGVKPLLTCYRERPDLMRGAVVADTVIGKAAAVVLSLAGVRAVYGRVLSRAAIPMLEAHGIAFSCGEEVPLILNRTGDGSCPLEASVADLDDPCQAFPALTDRIAQLMAGNAAQS